MLEISQTNNIQRIYSNKAVKQNQPAAVEKFSFAASNPINLTKVSSENLKAYNPSFTAKTQDSAIEKPSRNLQLRTIKSKLDKTDIKLLEDLEAKGILDDNSSNDGSTVLDNLYLIATEPRIRGLSDKLILKEVIKALSNPASITQKFGDIPVNVAQEIQQETGTPFPEQALNVISSSCVVASMEFNLASRKPAEFVRFAQGLSGRDYSVVKNIKMSDIAQGTAECLWKLREFNTNCEISNNWEDVSIKLQPDRNAIVRARVQTSYKDPNERSCIDVLIQSALLNLGSQNTYDALTDERTGKFNPDKSGLTDFEKTFVEEVVFNTPKISVVYQSLDENGYLTGYNCTPEETKQHILKSLELGHNVIIGYTHMDADNKVDGGHEITITGYEQDANGNGFFICNDTDDNIDQLVKISEEQLLPLIHHAGIPKDALSENDVVVESWREIIENFQREIKSDNKENLN